MSTSRRAQARRDVADCRRSFLRPRSQRRALERRPVQRRIGHVEALEARSLMAADGGIFLSNFWNHRNPTDVNADGQVSPLDLLPIINSITTDGVRTLPGKFIGPGATQPATAGTLRSAEGEA